MKIARTWVACLGIVMSWTCSLWADQPHIDLAGSWQVALDRDGTLNPKRLATGGITVSSVRLPGALRDSGIGDPVGPATKWIGTVKRDAWEQPQFARYRTPDNFKVPFWLQPERRYVGVAWYQRKVVIPEAWAGQRIVLHLERPHWQSAVFVDGDPAGRDESLSTPHEFDLTQQLTPGAHTLAIRVDNSLANLDVGENSHSVSDHTQSAWHGIVGRIDLRAEPRVTFVDIQVFPAADARRARVQVTARNTTGAPRQELLTLKVTQADRTLADHSVTLTLPPGESQSEHVLQFASEAQRWDEFHPALCSLQASLGEGGAKRSVTFGVRSLGTDGTQFILNGRPLFFRGTLECAIFPLTGYPPTDAASWKRIIRICKANGLNHLRFHSWCPPQAAFIAADELGFYYQVECSTWPNTTTDLGTGKPIDTWLYREAQRILQAYGNHPSFMLLCAGNEPAGPQRGGKYLGAWVEHFKSRDDRRLVTGGAGWPSIGHNQFHVTPNPRIQGWGQGLRSRINAAAPETTSDYRDHVARSAVPLISHEIGQWCVYPDFEEIARYTGPLKPRNFEVFRDLLADAHMPDQARAFLMASGMLQVLCYREDIESALRTRGFGGFQLLDLHDFPGQGTALVGMLDPFWNNKPYLAPETFRRFCGPVVPLARLPRRVFTSNETLQAAIEIYQFGPSDLSDAQVRWQLQGPDGAVLDRGAFEKLTLGAGGLHAIGSVDVALSKAPTPAKLKLVVSIAGSDIENDWDIWVYPEAIQRDRPANVHLARSLDEAALKHLRDGGRVMLLADPHAVRTGVALGFSSIFWNTAWTGGQAPHTLGILCDPSHRALAEFPTEYHSNWQWWDLVAHGATMELDALAPGLRPIVQVVPDWNDPKRLALVFEAKVGSGRLLVCSMDLETNLDARPVARQMRRSLMNYASGDSFNPAHAVTIEQLAGLFKPVPLLKQVGATASADSFAPGYEAIRAIDGDPKTIWHTAWEPAPAPMPHALTIDLKQPTAIAGVTYLPRQDAVDNGNVADWAIHTSDDGVDWGKPKAQGTWPATRETQRAMFQAPVTARFIRLQVRASTNGRPFACAAEVDVLPAR